MFWFYNECGLERVKLGWSTLQYLQRGRTCCQTERYLFDCSAVNFLSDLHFTVGCQYWQYGARKKEEEWEWISSDYCSDFRCITRVLFSLKLWLLLYCTVRTTSTFPSLFCRTEILFFRTWDSSTVYCLSTFFYNPGMGISPIKTVYSSTRTRSLSWSANQDLLMKRVCWWSFSALLTIFLMFRHNFRPLNSSTP
jgi:hypothetical protein